MLSASPPLRGDDSPLGDSHAGSFVHQPPRPELDAAAPRFEAVSPIFDFASDHHADPGHHCSFCQLRTRAGSGLLTQTAPPHLSTHNLYFDAEPAQHASSSLQRSKSATYTQMRAQRERERLHRDFGSVAGAGTSFASLPSGINHLGDSSTASASFSASLLDRSTRAVITLPPPPPLSALPSFAQTHTRMRTRHDPPHTPSPATATSTTSSNLSAVSVAAYSATKGTLRGHAGGVWSCSFNSTGDLLASAGSDRVVHLWDVELGLVRRSFLGHSDSVVACAFSPSDLQILSGSTDCTMMLWDMEHGGALLRGGPVPPPSHSPAPAQVFTGHTRGVQDCAFRPQNDAVVSASFDTTLRLYDMAGGQCLQVLQGHSNAASGCKFTESGKAVVSSSWDGTLRVWEFGSTSRPLVLDCAAGSLYGCAIADDGFTVATVAANHCVQLWDLRAMKQVSEFGPLPSSVWSCAFSPQSKLVAATTDDGQVHVWNTNTLKRRHVLKGHTGSAEACAFSPAQHMMASASEDGSIKLWDVKSGCAKTHMIRRRKTVGETTRPPRSALQRSWGGGAKAGSGEGSAGGEESVGGGGSKVGGKVRRQSSLDEQAIRGADLREAFRHQLQLQQQQHRHSRRKKQQAEAAAARRAEAEALAETGRRVGDEMAGEGGAEELGSGEGGGSGGGLWRRHWSDGSTGVGLVGLETTINTSAPENKSEEEASPTTPTPAGVRERQRRSRSAHEIGRPAAMATAAAAARLPAAKEVFEYKITIEALQKEREVLLHRLDEKERLHQEEVNELERRLRKALAEGDQERLRAEKLLERNEAGANKRRQLQVALATILRAHPQLRTLLPEGMQGSSSRASVVEVSPQRARGARPPPQARPVSDTFSESTTISESTTFSESMSEDGGGGGGGGEQQLPLETEEILI